MGAQSSDLARTNQKCVVTLRYSPCDDDTPTATTVAVSTDRWIIATAMYRKGE